METILHVIVLIIRSTKFKIAHQPHIITFISLPV